MNAKKDMESQLETAPLGRLLLKMAIPGVLSQLLLLLYNMVDRIYLGRLPSGGEIALTAVGICVPITYLLNAVAILFGQGGATRAVIALAQGQNDESDKILGNSILSMIVSGIIISVAMNIWAEPIMLLLGAGPDTLGDAVTYMRIYSAGAIFIEGYMGLLQFMITQGFTKDAMFYVLAGAISNVIVDPILIFGFRMGVAGAAIATVLSQAIIAVCAFCFLCGKKSKIRVRKSAFRPDFKTWLTITSLGAAPAFTQIMEAFLSTVMNSSMQKFGGDIATLGITLTTGISMLIWMPSTGINQGAQSLISYNYGKENYKRVRQVVKMLMLVQFVFFGTCTALLEIFPQWFIKIFSSEAAVIETDSWMLRYFMVGFFFLPILNVIQQTFISIGDSKMSFMLIALRKLILHTPLLFLLPFMMSNKALGIVLSEPISDVLTVLAAIIIAVPVLKKRIGK